VLLFGSGGQLVEVYKDRALALPPLNSTLARRMMEGTKIYKALKGVRGRKPVDLAALESLLVAFSNLVVEQPWIKEIDINPLLASADRLLALDARVVIYEKDTREEDLPKPAIRPYPVHYVSSWKTAKGLDLTIRPIRPEDEPLVANFHEHLSERSVLQRYFQPLKLSQRTAHERLTRICFIDYDREMALVAEGSQADGAKDIIGVVRVSRVHGTPNAEMAMIVRDGYQDQGVGTELLRRSIEVARAEGMKKMIATILADNKEMQSLCRKLGFEMNTLSDRYVRAELAL
jgi:acetyltransferase